MLRYIRFHSCSQASGALLFLLGGHVRPTRFRDFLILGTRWHIRFGGHSGSVPLDLSKTLWSPQFLDAQWGNVGQTHATCKKHLGHPGRRDPVNPGLRSKKHRLPTQKTRSPFALILYTPVEVARTVLLHGCHGPSCSTQSPFSSPPTDFNLT